MDAICDHVIAGETATGFIANPFTFIIRLVGGKYQAISATGTLTYGGTDDEGSVDGDSFHDVLEAAVSGCGSYGTVRAVGNCHMAESYTLNAATAGAVSIYFDNLFLDNNTDGFIVTHATGGVWIGRLVGNSINYPSGYTATVITLKNVRYGHVDIDWIAPTSGIGDVGSIAVDIQADGGDNYKNYIRFGNLSQCYYGMRMYATTGYGNYFNTIHCGAIENSYTGLELRIDGAGSYVNANKFYNFDIREMATRGKYGVLMYGTNGTDGANGNDFYSFSISNLGDATDYGYYVDGEDNDFFGARTVDFSGDAIDVYQLDGDNYFINWKTAAPAA
jgi:hypothetical protein